MTYPAVVYPPTPNPRTPDLKLPPNACDCHFHVFGPPDLFPYAPDRLYTPPAAPIEHYLNLMEVLGLERGMAVQSTTQGPDNLVTLDAITKAGGKIRGVAKLDDSATDDYIQELHEGGIRGVRFNLIPEFQGGSNISMFENIYERIEPYGWAVCFFSRPPQFIEHVEWFKSLRTPTIIDHFASVEFADGVDQEAFQKLLELLEYDHMWVKVSCVDRLTAEPYPYPDAHPFMNALCAVAPDRIVWGLDWPHQLTYKPNATPDDGDLVDLVATLVPDAELRNKILVDNPARLYWADTL